MGRALHLHHLLPHSLLLFHLFFLFSNYCDIFGCIWVLYRCGNPALGGLLAPWAMALRPDVVACGARPLTPRRRVLRLGHARSPLLAAPGAAAHGVMSLTPWATALDVYFC
jgi:hypothetical protein